ncbi:MAG: hypothetical protein L7S56_02040 [Candidatus Poseidonia sp.]|nr:hypothetical protein [Poseidonia sp.]
MDSQVANIVPIFLLVSAAFLILIITEKRWTYFSQCEDEMLSSQNGQQDNIYRFFLIVYSIFLFSKFGPNGQFFDGGGFIFLIGWVNLVILLQILVIELIIWMKLKKSKKKMQTEGTWGLISNKVSEGEGEDSEPPTIGEVLEAMERELKKAIEDAENIRIELDTTIEKVSELEATIIEKDDEILCIKESKNSMETMLNEAQNDVDSKGKNLSLVDSVMVGDSLLGGLKIEKQINNDADTIAKAVIEAYKSGLNDSK